METYSIKKSARINKIHFDYCLYKNKILKRGARNVDIDSNACTILRNT